MIDKAIIIGVLILVLIDISNLIKLPLILVLLVVLKNGFKIFQKEKSETTEFENDDEEITTCIIRRNEISGEKYINITDLAKFNIIDEIVIKKTKTEDVLSALTKLIKDMTGTDKIVIYKKEAQKRVLINRLEDSETQATNISPADKQGRIIILEHEEIGNEYFDVAISFRKAREEVLICPIVVDDKEFGAILLISKIEKDIFNKENKILISYLINQSRVAIESTQMQKKILDNTRIEKEVMIASEIQKKLLPQEMRFAFGLEIANYFNPAKEIGGDYYDYFMSAEGLLGVAVGDVSGKGVPAALIMTLVRAVLRTLAAYDISPDEALTRLNQILYGDMGEEMFVTLVYSLYDEEERELYISNAGHTPIIIYNNITGEVVEKKIKGAAIGFLDSYKYKLEKIKLNYGDTLIYYTDGITEAENENKELFGVERLLKCIKKNREDSAIKMKEKILKEVLEFQGSQSQGDDITLVVLKVKR